MLCECYPAVTGLTRVSQRSLHDRLRNFEKEDYFIEEKGIGWVAIFLTKARRR